MSSQRRKYVVYMFAEAELSYHTHNRNMRFLIVHHQTHVSLNKFLNEFKKNRVTTIMSVCEAAYHTAILEKEGIWVLDWPSGDGF
uniref:Uncharacterized protein n=1 Tax=Ursus americanus TaxID=9643 RepID=A0A452RNE5_URSAM